MGVSSEKLEITPNVQALNEIYRIEGHVPYLCGQNSYMLHLRDSGDGICFTKLHWNDLVCMGPTHFQKHPCFTFLLYSQDLSVCL